MMELKTFLNPDGEYARKKKKLIKKHNGFCLGEKHVEEWRCPCKSFQSMNHEGYCGEGLYYKQYVEVNEA